MSTKSNLLENLNKEQLEAVTHKGGPLLIIAGAGTGKTTVITKRIAWLIEKGIAKPEEILALTFTEKSAREMDERILELLPYGVMDFTASTFHSFCQDLIKTYGIMAGISPDFKLITEAQQILLIKQNIDKFDLDLYKPIASPNKFIGALVKLFSRTKDENISVDDYKKLAVDYLDKSKADPDNLELAENALAIHEQSRAYEIYEDIKTNNGFMDFGDLIIKCLWMLKSRAGILSKVQNKYKYIFVDEFQDTNFAQAKLAYLIATKFNNITVVGDDDQSIYKFRGAAISNMLEFVKHYPRASIVTLVRNYRSTQEILDLSYKLIKNNNPYRLEVEEKINKKLISNIRGKKPESWQFNDSFTEAETVTKEILSLVGSGKNQFNDYAILVRANSHADEIITLFKDNGVPFRFTGNRGLYDRLEIKELISYLKALYNPDDNIALFHVAWANYYKIDKILLRRLTNLSKKKNISLFELFCSIDSFPDVDEVSAKSIKKIIAIIRNHLECANKLSASWILADYINKSKMINEFQNIKNVAEEEIYENIKTFFKKISEFEHVSEDKSLFGFIEYLDLIIEAGDNPPVFEPDIYENAVNIMTIHASKGLEFDTVFLINLSEGKFPGRDRNDSIELPNEFIKEIIPTTDPHIQEERRLFYVGATRAKNKLILAHSDIYTGNKEPKKISRFVSECDGFYTIQDFTNKSKFDFLKIASSEPKNTNNIKNNLELVLSPSNIETYSDCPKRFEFSFFYRLSGDTNQSINFGNSIHNALRDIHKLMIYGNKVSNDKIIEIYNANWLSDGFISKTEANTAYNKGLEIVTELIKALPVPTNVEEEFKYKIDKNCSLIGRIDKINETADIIEITDYKTGDGRKKTKSEVTKNLPLWIYAIGIKDKHKNKDIILTLYYVMNNKPLSLKVTSKKLEEKKQIVSKLCAKISESLINHDFPAKPNEQNCKLCTYKSICTYKSKNA
jgi:DNA helicase-2/ATP-dependent DNA helicase PcrA